jgi:hypothetical protein
VLVGTLTNQIFIGRYRVNSQASAATQNITSVTSLFWWKNGTGWQYWQGKTATCRNAAGAGKAGCTFGSPASDMGVSGPYTPTFYNLPRGYYYTVNVQVTWSTTAGTKLAQALYYPTAVSTDIGCANYAQYILKPSRCSGPYSGASGYGSLYFP